MTEEHEELYQRLGVWPEVGNGWLPIIKQLADDIDALNIPYRVVQVKEKFGELRFYFDCSVEGGYDQIEKLVDAATDESRMTCEVCGAPGKPRGGGWIRTLCDEHDRLQK